MFWVGGGGGDNKVGGILALLDYYSCLIMDAPSSVIQPPES